MHQRLVTAEARLHEHSLALATLSAQIAPLARAIEANTIAINEHSSHFSEYRGAQKLVHFIITIGSAIIAYIVGKQG